MDLVLTILSWVCLITGTGFCLLAAIGLLRFPDVYTRIHAAGMSDTMGVGLVVLGLLLQAPSWIVAVKLIMIVLFLWLTGPAATHALAQSAYAHGVEPVLGDAPNPLRTERRHEEEQDEFPE